MQNYSGIVLKNLDLPKSCYKSCRLAKIRLDLQKLLNSKVKKGTC